MSLKYSYIYMATNKINGKSYIGQTINFKRRKYYHFYSAKRKLHDFPFTRALRKYGKESFEWHILFEGPCHPNKLNSLEIFFIAYYNTMCSGGYNLTKGGQVHLSEEKRKQASKKFAETMSEINPETGLTRARENAINSANTMKQVDPKTGLTTYHTAGRKTSTARRKINPETGLSLAQEASKQMVETRKRNDSYKSAGIKQSQTIAKKKLHQGLKNSQAKMMLIVLPNGQLVGSHGNFLSVCRKYGVSYPTAVKHWNIIKF